MNPILRRRLLSSLACAVRSESPTWVPAPLAHVTPASRDLSLFSVSVDVSSSRDLLSSFTSPGQYVSLRLPDRRRPSLFAIASPPSDAAGHGRFDFLLKKIAGSTAEILCGMREGDLVEIGGVFGNGFEITKLSAPEVCRTVLLFATGSGISPIRSLIESGFSANERSDVRLYYGARNLQRMAYQDRFNDWEASGVKIIPVLSQPDDRWKGERGYIQAAFSKSKQILKPSSTGAVFCGHRQMTEEITSMLVADGVSQEKLLKNY